ncbi:hypothetical protein FQN55_008107 [Onygenales sp. PD_40]|nr:hypothetical protein FQN55_008107 [Onygenales sp. PD_40]
MSTATTTTLPSLSPAELSYLHTSLSHARHPIRTDGRSATQFRPLSAETGLLPGANGSARIGFADGTQAIVGVKGEVERTGLGMGMGLGLGLGIGGEVVSGLEDQDQGEEGREGKSGRRGGGGRGEWVEMSIEIPGLRDDDPLPVFLAEMMREGLVGSGGEEGEGGLKERLVINQGWHWRIYIDILLLSPPLSYPLPLLSLTTHLALLSTKLPKLKSKDEEDPMFDDDWAAAEYLYPRRTHSHTTHTTSSSTTHTSKPPTQITTHPFRPPVTLLVIAVGDNIIFDPSREEIAVAEAVLAVTVGRTTNFNSNRTNNNNNKDGEGSTLKLLSIRTIDPPSRLTSPGIPNKENAATIGFAMTGAGVGEGEEVGGGGVAAAVDTGEDVAGVWSPRRGGVKRAVIARIVRMVLKRGGVGEEVMEGLEGVEVG